MWADALHGVFPKRNLILLSLWQECSWDSPIRCCTAGDDHWADMRRWSLCQYEGECISHTDAELGDRSTSPEEHLSGPSVQGMVLHLVCLPSALFLRSICFMFDSWVELYDFDSEVGVGSFCTFRLLSHYTVWNRGRTRSGAVNFSWLNNPMGYFTHAVYGKFAVQVPCAVRRVDCRPWLATRSEEAVDYTCLWVSSHYTAFSRVCTRQSSIHHWWISCV